MASKLKNISNLFQNSRTRAILVVTIGLLIVMLVTGILKLRKETPKPGTSIALQNAPANIQSVPGGFEQPETAEYAKLQTQQNVTQAEIAQSSGGSAVPTITSSSTITGAWQGGNFSSLNQPQQLLPGNYLLRRNQAGGLADAQGIPVYNQQGLMTGLAYGKGEGRVCVMDCSAVGTMGPDGLIRDAKGNVIGKAASSALGTPVYDAQGRLIGYAGTDGKVRDLKGNAIGSIGPDGVFRTNSGKPGGAALGVPVYDANGRLIGYAGPDGKVRGLNGNIIGTMSPDGAVRDAKGNIIGKAGASQLGTPVYDAQGRLIGYAGPDGKVRDLNGNVIGTVGPDGSVRNASGKIIGKTVPPEANSLGTPVYDAQGRLIGYAGPDGKVRDANGNVIGTVGPDGTVRDASGKIIGKTAVPATSALGTPVYDAQGRLIGYAGPDAKVRDANGNVIGTVGPDGTVRDASGKIIGKTAVPATSALGTPVYDAQGRLIGYAGPDAKVRDANGNVIGTVGPDGTVRDASGKIIGKTAVPATSALGTPVYDANGRLIGYASPDGTVRDANGKVVGNLAADGTLRDANGNIIGKVAGSPGGTTIPAGSTAIPSTESDQLQAIRQRQALQQAQQAELQKTQQNQQQLSSTMSAQQSLLFAAWSATPTQQYVEGTKKENKGEGGKEGAGGMGANIAIDGKGGANACTPPLIKAGTILFAVLTTGVNSDEPGPVMATIVGSRLKGGKLLGTLVNQGEKVMLTFNVLTMPSTAKSISINAVAIDPDTARTALSSDTDNHYLLRYGSLFASSFMQGYGQAIQQSGSTVISNGLNTVTNMPDLSAKGQALSALGTVGQNWGQAIRGLFNKPPTVKVYSGTGLGILFLQDVVAPIC